MPAFPRGVTATTIAAAQTLKGPVIPVHQMNGTAPTEIHIDGQLL
jgi:hypothetical protein